MLDLEFECIDATAANALQVSEFVSDFEESSVHVAAFIGCIDGDLLSAQFLGNYFRDDLAHKAVGNAADQETNRKREDAQDDGNTPLWTSKRLDDKGSATDEDDECLTTNHDQHDPHEEPVLVQAFEDVLRAVDATTVDCIEDLHPHEDVEDERALSSRFVVKKARAGEE